MFCVRALNDAKNYAQQGCAMQFNGITLNVTKTIGDVFSTFSPSCLSGMQMRGLLVNFILVQFKEGLKIQSPHQNNKPPTPPPIPPKKGDYIVMYIYLLTTWVIADLKIKKMYWCGCFLVQWVLQREREGKRTNVFALY